MLMSQLSLLWQKFLLLLFMLAASQVRTGLNKSNGCEQKFPLASHRAERKGDLCFVGSVSHDKASHMRHTEVVRACTIGNRTAASRAIRLSPCLKRRESVSHGSLRSSLEERFKRPRGFPHSVEDVVLLHLGLTD